MPQHSSVEWVLNMVRRWLVGEFIHFSEWLNQGPPNKDAILALLKRLEAHVMPNNGITFRGCPKPTALTLELLLR